MSMRKYIRGVMRASAQKHNYKPSKAVHALWTRYQIDKNSKTVTTTKGGKEKIVKRDGIKIRTANQARGTHKKKLWRSRIASLG